MATKPRVVCHKERKPSNDKGKIVQSEHFISADEFMKEFSFSIDAEDSKRFTNNFVEFPTMSEFKSQTSLNLSTSLLTSNSLQDLSAKSDTQLQSTISENFNSLQLVKNKQQSLTDISMNKKVIKKTQTKAIPTKPHSSNCKRDKRPDSKIQLHTRDKLMPLTSDAKSKSRTTIRKPSMSTPEEHQQIPFDSSRLLTSQHTRPPSVDVTILGKPQVPPGPPGMSLDIQNGLLLSAIHLNLSAQRAYAETEKEAVTQLSKLHTYKQKLLQENCKLKSEVKRLEIQNMTTFALGELGSVEEVLTKLKLAGAQILKLTEALSRAQSSVKLKNIQLSERDRDKCEKHLRELSIVATRSLASIRSLLSNVYEVCDKLKIITKEREEDLKRVREASQQLERYAEIMLSKVSLQCHANLLEENLDLISNPDKLYTKFPD